MFSKLLSKQYTFIFISVVALMALAVYFFTQYTDFFTSQQLSQQSVVIPATDKEVTITVASTEPATQIENININALNDYFDSIGYKPEQQAWLFGQKESLQPQRVQLIFSDIERRDAAEQLFLTIKSGNGTLIEGATSHYNQNDNSVIYTIYTNGLSNDLNKEQKERYLAYATMRLFFFLKHTAPTQVQLLEFDKAVGDFLPPQSEPLITLKQTSSNNTTIYSLLATVLQPKAIAFAQTCGGHVECGFTATTNNCPQSEPCNSGVCRDSGYVCQNSITCTYVPSGQNCANFSSPSCSSAASSICGGVSTCVEAPISGSCYNPGSGGGNGEPPPSGGGGGPPAEEPQCGTPCTDSSQCGGNSCAPDFGQGRVCWAESCNQANTIPCGGICETEGGGLQCDNGLTCTDLGDTSGFGRCINTTDQNNQCYYGSELISGALYVNAEGGTTKSIVGSQFSVYLNGEVVLNSLTEYNSGGVYSYRLVLLGEILQDGDVVSIHMTPPAGWSCGGWHAWNAAGGYDAYSSYNNRCYVELTIDNNNSSDWNNFFNLIQINQTAAYQDCGIYGLSSVYTEGFDITGVNLSAQSAMSSPQTSRAIITTSNGDPVTVNGVQITSTPQASLIGAKSVTSSSGNYYYVYTDSDDCLPGGSNLGCSAASGSEYSLPAITDLPVGDYYAFCDVSAANNPAELNRCSGNPFGGPWTGGPANWARCANESLTDPENQLSSDRRAFAVEAAPPPPCTVSCTEGCGGNDTGATPGIPTNIRVNSAATGANIDLSTNGNLTFSWTASTIAAGSAIGEYQVRIWERNSGGTNTTPPEPCNQASNCRAYTGITPTSPTVSVVQAAHPDHTDQVFVAVRAINTVCSEPSDWSAAQSYDLVARVSGSIYNLTTGPDSLNECIGTGDSQDITAASPTISLDGTTGTLNIAPGSTYQFTNVPYAPASSWTDYGFDIDLSLGNSFFCNCPGGNGDQTQCTHTDTTSPATNQNFFVMEVDLSNGPWWQTSSGNVYGAQSYTSDIPESCADSPDCNANLITQNADQDSKSAGITLTGGATISANGYYTEYNTGGTPPATQPKAFGTTHANVQREDYDFFIKNINLSTVQTIPGSTLETLPTPNGSSTYDGAEVYFAPGNLTIQLSTVQNVPAGTAKIIFVNGDVLMSNTGAVDRSILTVEEGGYFAVIASGDIAFEKTIGNEITFEDGGLTTPNIAGVYIASNELIIQNDNNEATRDNLFVGEGTFVGWEGVQLLRTYNNSSSIFDAAINATYPTTNFIFRPDFNRNTPAILRRPSLVWQEVN